VKVFTKINENKEILELNLKLVNFIELQDTFTYPVIQQFYKPNPLEAEKTYIELEINERLLKDTI
jgi:hypothetical protein